MKTHVAHVVRFNVVLLNQLEQRTDERLIRGRGGPRAQRNLFELPTLAQTFGGGLGGRGTGVGGIKPAVGRRQKFAGGHEVLLLVAAAGDVQHLAVDEARAFRGEEQDRVGDVVPPALTGNLCGGVEGIALQ